MNYLEKLFSLNEIIESGEEKGFQFAIRENSIYVCSYVALPKGHKYFNIDYGDIPLLCHGGLTFGYRSEEYHVIGWDYGHFDDFNRKVGLTELIGDIYEVIDQLTSVD